MKTEQELFWESDFGDNYTDRNNEILINPKKEFFNKVLRNIKINSVFEIGCNRGLNLEVIKKINNNICLNGIEINKKAYNILNNLNICSNLYNDSIFNLIINKKFDLVFTFGVLIHLNPEYLTETYKKMYELSNKYILIGEYYSRNVQEINYRGHNDKLFKRDFCSELLNIFPDLKLIDYGFVYHKDPKFALDDITWFLLEKN